MQEPLILVTNDDGIASIGLWQAAEALIPLGEVMIVAPDRQWSGGGRSMPPAVTGRIQPASCEINGRMVTAYAVDASPAMAVDHGVLELAPRRPALVVSGINSGLNLSIEVTISGTVGAALEASAFGIPALAVSLEMDPAFHLTGDNSADYSATKYFTHQFAQTMLAGELDDGVDVLNLNVPADATPHTSWRVTRLSRHRYFTPLAPDRTNGGGRPAYCVIADPRVTEPDSDIHVVAVDREVSISPLTLDLTARVFPDRNGGPDGRADRSRRLFRLLQDRRPLDVG